MRLPRNPRRAYDPDGREIPPATIRAHKSDGLRTIMAECDDCQHGAVVDVTGFRDDVPVPHVALNLRCSECGSKRTHVCMNMIEFYEVLNRRRAGHCPV